MHWHGITLELAIPLLAAGAVLVFDLVRLLKKGEPSVRAYLAVILLVLGGVNLRLLSQDRPEVEHLGAHLKLQFSDGHAYVSDLIDSTLSNLKYQLDHKNFKTESLDSTLVELERAIRHARRGDQIFGIDYGIPWGHQFKDYAQANLAAAKNGVAITRVFIVPEPIIKDEIKAQGLWETMKEQRRQGIKVLCVKESKLASYHQYKTHDKGLVEFQLGAKKVLMVEAVRYWEAIQEGEPPRLEVYWDASNIAGWETYFAWLTTTLGPNVIPEIDPKGKRPF